MPINGAVRVPLLRTFDHLHRDLDRPALYGIPWQVPSGTTYDEDIDAWIDGNGDVVTKTPSELSYYAIPALWGADAEGLALAMGGIVGGGDLVGIAKADYSSQLEGSFYVVTGSLSGDAYNVSFIENAPDGGAAVFTVIRLQRKEQ